MTTAKVATLFHIAAAATAAAAAVIDGDADVIDDDNVTDVVVLELDRIGFL